MQTITISGTQYNVAPRYAEGHTLNANEAAALNQTYFENLRNNFAGKAKEGASQEDFDTYAGNYQFGVRTGGGGGSRDPIKVEAMNLARDAIKKSIQQSGKKISDYTGKAITAAAEALLEKNPAYLAKAAERVKEMQAIAGESVDASILEGLGEPNAEGASEGEEATADEPTSRRRRAAAAE